MQDDGVAQSEPWTIEKLIPGGEGIAHLPDGRIGFAAGVLPGERVLPVAVEDKRRFVRATALTVLEPSPERISPPCEHAERCGGCDWLHIDYPAQLRHKLVILRDALTRTGKLEQLPALAIEPAPQALAYRNRIRLQLERGKVGYRARGSHALVEITRCPVALPELDAALSRLRAFVADHPELSDWFGEAELRVAPSGPPALVRLAPRRPFAGQPQPAALVRALAAELPVAVAGEPSDAVQRWPLPNGGELSVSPDAFVQVNWAVNQQIVGALLDEVERQRLRSFVDLYAGAGNFSLPLWAAGLRGVAVEAEGSAALAAKASMRTQGLPGEVLACDVVAGVERLIAARRRFELVLLDPTRAGAAELVPRLAELGPRSIAYCACDPVTLARDLGELVRRGFSLQAVRAFDMFPGTHHFETLAWLSR